MRSKLFPDIDDNLLEKLQIDDEGLWSITLPNEATLITEIILETTNNNESIMDCTAGVGGNLFSFGKNFKKILGIEICKTRFLMLENNLKLYNLDTIEIINDNFLNYLNEYNIKKYNIFFIDPPWGGPNYKDQENILIKIDNISLLDIVKKIKIFNKNVFLKLPKNYDLNEFQHLNYKIYKIKNYLLIHF